MDRETLITIIAVAVGVFLLCVILSIASFSGEKFMSTYKKLMKKTTSSPYTVSAFIGVLNAKYFKNQIRIQAINVLGGEFYNSKNRIVGLNMSNETSLASFAVVAHELGHAYQDMVLGTLGKFNMLRRAGIIIGRLFLPILIAGIVLLFIIENYVLVIVGTILVLAFIVLLAIIIKARTIKLEKEASKIGLELLKEFLDEVEIKTCKKLLDDARMTYWADLIKLLLSWSGLVNKTKMFR